MRRESQMNFHACVYEVNSTFSAVSSFIQNLPNLFNSWAKQSFMKCLMTEIENCRIQPKTNIYKPLFHQIFKTSKQREPGEHAIRGGEWSFKNPGSRKILVEFHGSRSLAFLRLFASRRLVFLYEGVSESRFFGRIRVLKCRFVCLFVCFKMTP